MDMAKAKANAKAKAMVLKMKMKMELRLERLELKLKMVKGLGPGSGLAAVWGSGVGLANFYSAFINSPVVQPCGGHWACTPLGMSMIMKINSQAATSLAGDSSTCFLDTNQRG
ncbi:GM22890 [Drosophila sechellia]|uniref:GM22890 n=1 Tax=Drosophila sechellia TaxID=7238 RepID=B4I6Q7_DROSE|nr:GM22890 [Drosophila sechellia]